MAHACHAHGCFKSVPPRMFMCSRHWFSLRKPMQDAIWREYRSGQEMVLLSFGLFAPMIPHGCKANPSTQEIDKKPSPRYLAVAQRAIGEVAFKPYDEQAAASSAPYLLRAEELRRECIESGVGDPLEGLAGMVAA